MLTPDEIQRMRAEHVQDDDACAVCIQSVTGDGIVSFAPWPCDAAKLLPEVDRRGDEIQDLECELLIQYGRHPKRVEDCPSCVRGLRPVPEKVAIVPPTPPPCICGGYDNPNGLPRLGVLCPRCDR